LSTAVDRSNPPQRFAVTGLGAVSAAGWSIDAFWRALLDGASLVRAPARFDASGQRTTVLAEVPPEPADLAPARDPRWASLGQADRFAVAAAVEAWAAAAPDHGDGRRIGLFFGGSTAAMAEGEEFFLRLMGRAPGRPRIQPIAAHPLDAPGNAVARWLGIRGQVESFSSACASGALALGAALDALRDGTIDVAVAGGADSLCRLTYSGFNALRAVDAAPCRPFRVDRGGLSVGEGAAVLVIEPLERALARGRRPLAILAGAGASCDAFHMTAPHPQGDGAARAMKAALVDGGVEPGAIAFVNTHGTGTPLNDQAEAQALRQVFGDALAALPLTSTKGVVGHFLGSSGAIEAAATVLCLRHGLVHATPGDGPADPALGVDLVVGAPRPVGAEWALSTSLAFGGSNAAVLFARGGG
jgi:3-oxoacyl-(acyl-carrier-protein) synthase